LLAHLKSPLGPKFLHRPYDTKSANPTNYTKYSEEPSVTNGIDERLGDHTSNAAENIPHEVVHRNATAAALGKELCEPGKELVLNLFA
jgi:hypothetical protein